MLTELMPVTESVSNETVLCNDFGLENCVKTPLYAVPIVIGVVLAITLNLFNIIVMSKINVHLGYRGYFLMNLAVADLLSGVVLSSAIYYSVHQRWPCRKLASDMVGFFTSVVFCESILSLTMVSCERYLSVVWPLHYPRWVNQKSCVIVIVCSWLQSIAIFSMPFLGIGNFSYEWMSYVSHYDFRSSIASASLGIMITVSTVAIVTFCFVRIFLITRHHVRTINAQMSSVPNSTAKRSHLGKGIKMIGVTVLVFALLWFPYVIMETVYAILQVTPSRLADFIGGYLGGCNAFINPLIYYYTSDLYRKKSREFLRRVLCRKALEADNNAALE
ncbi:alpha-1A adrenergic receptor-like [Lineus longissimus]|uniref:alpha-1A adrenergic receptor-like n=1 Tax=Lineus longissimus TaxID=88925 RepID=UPI00315C5633